MPYYNTCPNCGSSLDPGESCDCQDEKEETNSDNQLWEMRAPTQRPEEHRARIRPHMLG